MPCFFAAFKEKQELKKILLPFHAEITKNLEIYYVMRQLNVIRLFSLEKRPAVCADIDHDERIMLYTTALAEYNTIAKDFKDYEQWYSQEIDHKTQDNARILHDKRIAAFEKLAGFEDIIKNVREGLEEELREKKILR